MVRRDATATSQEAATTVLLIHGVGDLPNEATRSSSERLIKSASAKEGTVRYRWFDWNKAVQEAQPRRPFELGVIAHATRASARLEFPDRVEGGIRAWLWRFETITASLQLPAMGLFFFHCVWLAAAWAAAVLHQEPPPLALSPGLDSVLFPPLDPLLLEHSLPVALRTIPISALAALVVIPGLQVFFAATAGGVSLRVAIRSAVLDVTRPLLGLLTAPGPVISFLIGVAGVLALLFAIFSRPVQILDVEGVAITFGNDRLGILVLPLALVMSALVMGVSVFLLRGPLKVVSDIVRYLGHPAYRACIHGDLIKRLAELADGPVVIVAHSLGSVIAVDSLLANPEAWSRFSQLRLLTCGSPLQRLFHGFFPATYPAPDILRDLLGQAYSDFSWTNAFRPLDYVGKRLGHNGKIVEKCFRQRWRLHIRYWTDVQLTGLVSELVKASSAAPITAAARTTEVPLSLDRFRYAPVGGEVFFKYLLRALYVAGCLALVTTQFVWAPAIEGEHLLEWDQRLMTEGMDLAGQLCPQREEDISGDFPGFQRAVAGVKYRTPDGRAWVLEAYSDTRPDIEWDEVQKEVFGRVPPSALSTGLRGLFFMRDPLLEVEECRPVNLRYATSDPRIFKLPARFHRAPTVGTITRVGRVLLLFFLWTAWWFFVSRITMGVLGVSKPKA